jgi:hypothetical protein
LAVPVGLSEPFPQARTATADSRTLVSRAIAETFGPTNALLKLLIHVLRHLVLGLLPFIGHSVDEQLPTVRHHVGSAAIVCAMPTTILVP